MPAYYPEGDAPLREDYTERSLQKINSVLYGNSPTWDDIELTYAGSNLTQVVYKLNGQVVETRNISYTGSNLTRVQKS
jgi:hypothetical protein